MMRGKQITDMLKKTNKLLICPLINKDINLNYYSKNAKIANVRPIFKKDERTKVKNYRPANLIC